MTKITIDRAIVEQALEALEKEPADFFDWLRTMQAARTALRVALANHSGDATEMDQEIEAAMADQVTYGLGITLDGKRIDPASIYKQAESATCQESRQVEPVAWMWEETAPRSSTGIGGIDRKLLFCRPADEPWKRNITPLYTAPPRQPVNLQDIEQYQLQMAGICTAALGYWTEDNSIHPDYDTPALRDVAKLYAKYAALYAAQSQRKPLTDEEIKSMWGITEYREFAIDFARAIERAHGIGDA